MYSMWKVNDLKAELKKRGASLQGRKAELVESMRSCVINAGEVVDKTISKEGERIYVGNDIPKLMRLNMTIGLCGGVHTGIARRIRRDFADRNADVKTHKLVCVGDKSRSMMRRMYASHILLSVKDIGRVAPTFQDAAQVAAALADTGYVYDVGEVYYNKFFSAVKYELTVIPIFNRARIEAAPNMVSFDDVDSEVLESYAEWTLAAILYYVLKEGAASEQSARMSAMDNATKNAGEMIRKLTLLFNRTRQSVITRELIEIISGAAALD